MFKVDIQLSGDISKEITRIQRRLKQFPTEAHAEFVALTPVNKGNARRNTTLRNDTIVADYPYAERLDQGWSKQAPKGMIQPFGVWMQKKVRSIFGK